MALYAERSPLSMGVSLLEKAFSSRVTVCPSAARTSAMASPAPLSETNKTFFPEPLTLLNEALSSISVSFASVPLSLLSTSIDSNPFSSMVAVSFWVVGVLLVMRPVRWVSVRAEPFTMISLAESEVMPSSNAIGVIPEVSAPLLA